MSFQAELGGIVVIVPGEQKETRSMSSQRAWLTARAVLSGGELEGCVARCRKVVWSDHLGCSYGEDNPPPAVGVSECG